MPTYPCKGISTPAAGAALARDLTYRVAKAEHDQGGGGGYPGYQPGEMLIHMARRLRRSVAKGGTQISDAEAMDLLMKAVE